MKFSRLNPLDRTAGGLSAVLILMIGSLVMAGSWVGVRVNISDLDGNGEVGPLGPIAFSFSEPVDSRAAQSLFSIDPKIPGSFQWQDSKTLFFSPLTPLQPNIDYHLTFASGSLGKNNQFLRKEHDWSVRVRKPQVIYLATSDNKIALWTVDTEGKSPQVLGKISLSIFDFDVAPNGEYVVFSAINNKQGLDLWSIDRNGNSLHLLSDCGVDRCTTPSISPDGHQVAYTREVAPITSSMPYGAPRPWILDEQSGENDALYSDPQIIGYGPAWSPDGNRITSYDGVQQVIHVVTLDSGEQIDMNSNTGDALTWSADGTRLMFTNIEDTPNGSRTMVNMADFSNGEISNVVGKQDDRDYQYDALAWSPSGSRVALGLEPRADDPAQAIWLMNTDLQDGQMIANESDTSYHAPRWDPWGIALVFQQFRLNGSYAPEIALWEPGLSKPRVVAQGLSPRWLP